MVTLQKAGSAESRSPETLRLVLASAVFPPRPVERSGIFRECRERSPQASNGGLFKRTKKKPLTLSKTRVCASRSFHCDLMEVLGQFRQHRVSADRTVAELRSAPAGVKRAEEKPHTLWKTKESALPACPCQVCSRKRRRTPGNPALRHHSQVQNRREASTSDAVAAGPNR